MPELYSIGWVLFGGGLGSAGRFILQRWASSYFGMGFPYGTMLVNIAGSLLIGFFFQWSEKSPLLNENTRLFLMTGLCGGFTTFSAITLESMMLMQEQKWPTLFLYIFLTIVLGITATLSGYWLAKTIIPH